MTRHSTYVVLAVALLLAAAPIAGVAQTGDLPSIDATGDDTLTATALDRPDATIERFGHPSWVVQLENTSDAASLRDWANSSDNRHLIDDVDATGYAVVAAPAAEIGAVELFRWDGLMPSVNTAALFSDGLAERSYVASIEPELAVSYPEPPELRSNASYSEPDATWLLRSHDGTDTVFSADGIAWSEDTERSTLADARQATGVDEVSATGDGITVAVIDTGTSVGDGQVFGNGTAGSTLRIHSDSKSFVTNESVSPATDNYSAIDDDGGHGSWVSAAIAANTSNDTRDGMAPDATLLVLQALDPSDGSGDSYDIARAIRYAADRDADVISMSLGSAVYTQTIAAAVQNATEQGSVVVIATGNSRFRGQQFVASPADTPGPTIAVGAANMSQNGSQALPAHFSQVGPDNGATDASTGVTTGESVTVVAPGMRIGAPVLSSTGTVQTSVLSGTSMATPLVAGAVAQLLAAEPSLQGNPAAVKARLTGTARRMPAASAAAVGHGHVAVDRAVANTTAEQTQREAMTADAQARDAGVRALSDASGGMLFRLAGGGYDDEEAA